MKSEIIIPLRPISKPLQELINEHNYHVEFTWRHVGSNCKPANAKRAAGATATLSEHQRPGQELGLTVGLRSDGSSSTSLTNDYR
jgi:hypothetical protein